MKKYLHKIIFLFILVFAVKAEAQLDLSSELGINFGVTSFQTDFGISTDFDSENAASLGFGVDYYIKFYGNQYNWRSGSSYFSDHFKLKASFLYTNNTNIRHEPWSGQGTGSEFDQKMEAMRGNITMYDFGLAMQYYFKSLENYSTLFADKTGFNPYLSAGIHFVHYDPKVTSSLNPNGGADAELLKENEPYLFLIDKWQEDAIYNDAGNTFAVSLGGGIRYSMQYFDLALEAYWQHFFSDEIDGLNAKDDSANKYNDTMINVNLGVIYTFNRY